jgi:hypothetical protein
MAGERSAKYRQEIQQVGAVTFSKLSCLSLSAIFRTGLARVEVDRWSLKGTLFQHKDMDFRR